MVDAAELRLKLEDTIVELIRLRNNGVQELSRGTNFVLLAASVVRTLGRRAEREVRKRHGCDFAVDVDVDIVVGEILREEETLLRRSEN